MLINYDTLNREIELARAERHETKCLRFINEQKDLELGFQLGILQMGNIYHIANDSRWSLHELVVHCIKSTGPASVYFCTYAIKEFQARLLRKMKDDGVITELHALIDYRLGKRDAGAEQLMKQTCTSSRWTKRLHGKVCVIKNDKWSVVILGSGNWTTNTSRDTFSVTCVESCGDYWINWIKKQIDEQP